MVLHGLKDWYTDQCSFIVVNMSSLHSNRKNQMLWNFTSFIFRDTINKHLQTCFCVLQRQSENY